MLMRDACQGLLGDWQFCIRLVCRQAESRMLPSPGKRLQGCERDGCPRPATPSLPIPEAGRAWGRPIPSSSPSHPRGWRCAAPPLRQRRHAGLPVAGTRGEPWGRVGSSHLLDVEQQQQLQRLHGWQERCEENAQPGRDGGRRARPGREPRGSRWWAALGAAAGPWCRLRPGFRKARSRRTLP